MRYFLEIVFTVLLITNFAGSQRLGDLCVVAETIQPGVCRHILNCPGALEGAVQGKPPQVCASPENKLIVCCPWVPGQETGLEVKCQAITTTSREGDNCTMVNTGRAGVCRPFTNCQTAKEAAYKGIFQQKCDLTDNKSELVCCTKADCPPLPKGLVTQLPIGSKAADYCIELAEKIHPCQETRSGWTRRDLCPLLTADLNIEYRQSPMTTTAEAPHFGLIGSGQIGNITWAGHPVSLVSDRWVLCSAISIERIGSNKVQFVGLGGTPTPRYNPDEIYGVSQKYSHPLFNSGYSRVYNNIAILRLDREVTFSNRILPACLHTGTSLPKSGFILTDAAGLKTTVQRSSQEECSKVFPAIISGISGHPDGVKHDLEICSRLDKTSGKICPSWFYGAPLTLPNSHRVVCTHLLVGLASWDVSLCVQTSTRISSFIPWIESIVWPESGVV